MYWLLWKLYIFVTQWKTCLCTEFSRKLKKCIKKIVWAIVWQHGSYSTDEGNGGQTL